MNSSQVMPTRPRSFKVAIWTWEQSREAGPTYNDERWATYVQAERAATDLAERWTAVSRFEIQDSNDPVNQEVNE